MYRGSEIRFWELVAVFRDEREILRTVLSRPEWGQYLDWFDAFSSLVKSQNRAKLDAIVPDKLADAAFRKHPGTLFVSNDHVTARSHADDDVEVPYHAIYRKYGGAFVEDVLEKGSARIPE